MDVQISRIYFSRCKLHCSCSRQDDIYSHGFTKAFSKKVFGVINIIEGEVSHYNDAVKTLKQIGVKEPYFDVNLANGEGLNELIKNLKLDERG